ncbi:hypothetical protein M438DRAFT_391677 [Aureobasidium pullulans EXF-150]|uniref:Uncharacterized protein n=1 Tax=Aureobasidium pullulans EXF-150 TaxID=1043002 RepID=A0A074XJ98_AURPU|nr:uncharacterized protein M438DRAFT_391677 [Aureobasidium pullulans EXF-150]KEQ85588.1 hypothetical protein M438DRAFT_391677 [Aureobasidium pullulans EXF-150]
MTDRADSRETLVKHSYPMIGWQSGMALPLLPVTPPKSSIPITQGEICAKRRSRDLSACKKRKTSSQGSGGEDCYVSNLREVSQEFQRGDALPVGHKGLPGHQKHGPGKVPGGKEERMIFLDQMVKDPWRVQSAVKYTSIARVQRSGLLTRVSEVRGLATLRLPGKEQRHTCLMDVTQCIKRCTLTIVAEKLVVDGLSIARTIFGSEGLKEIWQHDQSRDERSFENLPTQGKEEKHGASVDALRWLISQGVVLGHHRQHRRVREMSNNGCVSRWRLLKAQTDGSRWW